MLMVTDIQNAFSVNTGSVIVMVAARDNAQVSNLQLVIGSVCVTKDVDDSIAWFIEHFFKNHLSVF